MFINTRTQNNITILELSGRLDAPGASILEVALQNACETSPQGVVLDMSEVDYVNSTGLRVLARFLNLSRERACDLKLVGMTPNVERAVALVGLDSFFRPYATLQAAINTL